MKQGKSQLFQGKYLAEMMSKQGVSVSQPVSLVDSLRPHYCSFCDLDSGGNHAAGCPLSAKSSGQYSISFDTTSRLEKQVNILGELLHDIRNLYPEIEGMPGWKTAVESGALDGWV